MTKLFYPALLIMLSFLAPAHAKVYEPKEIKNVKALKPDEGVIRLSMRTQRQFIETAYLYFVEVMPDGTDGERVLQFERGAGVPVMGTNMIDVKPKYYKAPAGKYRLLAYTVACAGVPPPGSVCTFYGNSLPTERYESGSPTIEVKQAALTDAGDFVVEYVKEVDLDNADLFADRFADEGYGVRWRAIKEPLRSDFAAFAAGPAPSVPAAFFSRIECDQRPKNKSVQFPFRCSSPSATK
jgi:hypothetical protein